MQLEIKTHLSKSELNCVKLHLVFIVASRLCLLRGSAQSKRCSAHRSSWLCAAAPWLPGLLGKGKAIGAKLMEIMGF